MKITALEASTNPNQRPRKKSDFVIGFDNRYCRVPEVLSCTMEGDARPIANRGRKRNEIEMKPGRLFAAKSGGNNFPMNNVRTGRLIERRKSAVAQMRSSRPWIA